MAPLKVGKLLPLITGTWCQDEFCCARERDCPFGPRVAWELLLQGHQKAGSGGCTLRRERADVSHAAAVLESLSSIGQHCSDCVLGSASFLLDLRLLVSISARTSEVPQLSVASSICFLVTNAPDYQDVSPRVPPERCRYRRRFIASFVRFRQRPRDRRISTSFPSAFKIPRPILGPHHIISFVLAYSQTRSTHLALASARGVR